MEIRRCRFIGPRNRCNINSLVATLSGVLNGATLPPQAHQKPTTKPSIRYSRILRGAKPVDISRAANQIRSGIQPLPPTLLALANEVIE
jgi:hypothetical protein